MGREIYSFDLETAAKSEKHRQYGGLQPWRIPHGTVHVTSASICRPDGTVWSAHRRTMGDSVFNECFKDMLLSLEGKIVYAHNAIFDVAMSIASLKQSRTDRIPSSIRNIRWYDTILLAKWLTNGQKADELKLSYALDNLVKLFMKDHPLCEEFVRMKAEKVDPGSDPYWERRNQMDVIMTQAMAVKFEDKLPDVQRNGYSTEAWNIVPAANSWVMGIRVDQNRLEKVEHDYNLEQKQILDRIKIPASTITSPKQLGHLLFNQMGLTPESYTPTGSPSTRSDDIKMMAFKVNQSGNEKLAGFMNDIIRYKQICTLKSKFVDGAKRALDHTGDGYMYGVPRIFGAYTGRFTYSSMTLDQYQTSVALHQIPRKAKEIRSLLVPPEGMMAYEADASGQESRLMTIRSGDQNLHDIFNNGFDLHSVTASYILGHDYHEFHQLYLSGDLQAKEHRQFGKLTNLSGNYRIGAKNLSKKAFEEYDLLLTERQTWYFLDVFKTRYAGIPKYWDDSISLARSNGYAETFGGRRYKITNWESNRVWSSESSALMTPIQGSGASQKNIAIKEIYENVPEADFALDLHDATFDWVPIEGGVRVAKHLDEVLMEIDYSKYWGFVPKIKLPFESHIGHSFADLK